MLKPSYKTHRAYRARNKCHAHEQSIGTRFSNKAFYLQDEKKRVIVKENLNVLAKYHDCFYVKEKQTRK